MPSPTSGFLGGLAQGIFGRMREHEDEQRKQDLEQRKQTLSYLTSLMDQTTPETRPILMQHIGDVMKLKGKHRGVWDMLTGKGRQNYSDALGAKLSEVLGSISGPAEFAKLQGGPQADVLGDAAGAGGGPAWMNSVIAPDQTAGRIALRDPQAEDLSQLRARYDLIGQQKYRDLQAKEEALYDRQSRLQEDRQKHEFDIASHKANLAAEAEARKLARTLAGGPGMPITDDIWERATGMIEQKYQLQLDNLRESVGLKKAKASEAIANATAAGSINPFTGLPSGDPLAGMKPGERVRFDQQQQQNAQSIYKQWSDAKAKVNEAYGQVQSIRAQLNATAAQYGAKFDEAKQQFVNADGTPNQTLAFLPGVAKSLQQLQSLKAEQAAAEGQVRDLHKTLGTQYSPYFDVGGDMWSVSPKAQFGGVAPTGAPRTAIPPFPEGAAGSNSQVTQYKTSKPLTKGKILETGKGRFRIKGLSRKDGNNYIYDLEPIE